MDSDPYQLVPLEEYSEDYPAPFTVIVNSDALVSVKHPRPLHRQLTFSHPFTRPLQTFIPIWS
jgi:hypothetical protein